ncbi:MAG TPA: bifunctional glutamate N-acetyltransferase/amino-acid acetyltransferase ArgJ [Anaerolineae bacterium]|nr:bifunctional glutamate N-acetyltransferase/amino-acid acetyltransferase ArgJ [Caldilineae bacterium]HID35244.1 bifunctional glutamate N-acetyltransferase/amino-acid acetyltransferase ArgJ [Anaerolineae bacterium]HIQ12601.1 bifunctional glutamate N-acetyltransferase/amino-acid acetyltransferase ArgJ [Caldilineales bacterium]
MPNPTYALPRGFRYAGVASGIKPDNALDLALIFTETPAVAAAVFTQNRFAAAPVHYDRALLERQTDRVHAVIINSGNANAVTGAEGLARAQRMAQAAERALGLPPWSALVMSTGVIGVQLPVHRIEAAASRLAEMLRSDSDGIEAAARAIMTTDTYPKIHAVAAPDDIQLAGICKGAGMIHPNMATMLAVIVTDAQLAPEAARLALKQAVDVSFNRISVDGDTSTNDTVALLANGAAGGPLIEPDTSAFDGFVDALTKLSVHLAQEIVRDGEGATKFVTIRVSGLANDDDAHQVAETIATSPLVKTAIYGGDANWGRILAAAGRSGVNFDAGEAELWISSRSPGRHAFLPALHLVAKGEPLDYDETLAAMHFADADLLIELHLGQGSGRAVMWTCDLSHEYVTINGEYRT